MCVENSEVFSGLFGFRTKVTDPQLITISYIRPLIFFKWLYIF